MKLKLEEVLIYKGVLGLEFCFVDLAYKSLGGYNIFKALIIEPLGCSKRVQIVQEVN